MENYSYNSSYPESGDSSPRSREIDYENLPPWEDANLQPPPNYKVKFMCSYGGKIHPRPHDNQLAYVGGETKILSVDRNVKFGALLAKLVALCDGENVSFKYQLPGEDLDALISVTNDDDLEHMMHEYERLYRISHKPARLRIFIFPIQNSSLNSSNRSFGSEDARSEKERFVEALNSAPIIAPPPSAAFPAAVPPPQPTNVDFLFGLERGNVSSPTAPQQRSEIEDAANVQNMDERLMGFDPIQKHIQHLQRLRLEEQQQREFYRRKSDDDINIAGAGDYYRPAPEKISQSSLHSSGVPYHVAAGGGYPSATAVTNEHHHQQQQQQQQVYVIPAPAGAFPGQMVRSINPQQQPPPPQAYYTYQRIPQELYREHQQQPAQQQIYSFTTTQSAAAPNPPASGVPSAQGYGMVRQQVSGGGVVVNEASGYGQMAYDGGVGRQVIYSTQPGGVMGAPVPSAAPPQYQAVPVGGVGADIRSAVGLPQEVKGVVAAATKVTTQTAV